MTEDQGAARDEGIARAADHNADWRTFASLALRDVAVAQEDLTSDDVWRVLHQHKIPDPTEPRAMGPVMLAGVTDEWITVTGSIRIADDPATPNHKRPQRVYRSRIVGARPAAWPTVNPLRRDAIPMPPPPAPGRLVFGMHMVCPTCKGANRNPICWNCQGEGYVRSL
jgi:hypothetical protein